MAGGGAQHARYRVPAVDIYPGTAPCCVLHDDGPGGRVLIYSPGCQLCAGTSDFVTIWDLLVISASACASADPYIFRVIIIVISAQLSAYYY